MTSFGVFSYFLLLPSVYLRSYMFFETYLKLVKINFVKIFTNDIVCINENMH